MVKSLPSVILLVSLVLTAGCDRAMNLRSAKPDAADRYASSDAQRPEQSVISESKSISTSNESEVPQSVSLNQVDQARSVADAMDRKILRDGQLTLESSSPAEAQRKVVSIAESLGGFVVASESKQQQNTDSAKRGLEITLIVRVPAQQFGPAVEQIRSAAARVIQEKLTGHDVTEEFIDLEARIKTQKALEAQFLEIMKQARKVEEALEVQRQIAEVRTEIERLEGRRRFLENRSALSTITINLQPPPALAVSTSSFRRGIREATGDGTEILAGLVLFLIRFVIVVTPVFLFAVLPGWLVTRYVLRRRRLKLASQLQSQPG